MRSRAAQPQSAPQNAKDQVFRADVLAVDRVFRSHFQAAARSREVEPAAADELLAGEGDFAALILR
jgi:hypothetical protein